MDIQQIPTTELQNDLIDSVNDIQVCRMALTHGVTEYSGGRVQDRMRANEKIVNVIRAELKRRGVTPKVE